MRELDLSTPPSSILLEEVHPDTEILQTEMMERIKSVYPDSQKWFQAATKKHTAFRPGGHLFREALNFCNTEHTDFTDIDTFGDKVVRILNRKHNQTPIERIMTYSNAYSGLSDLCHTQCGDSDTSFQNLNLVLGDAAEKSLESIDDKEELYQIWIASSLFSQVASNYNAQGFAAKLTSFADKAGSQALVRSYFEVQSKRKPVEYYAANINEDSKVLTDIFNDIYTTRNYDIKPAYINSIEGGSVILDDVADPTTFRDDHRYISPLVLTPRAIAEVIHNSEPDPKDLSFDIKESHKGYTSREYSHLSPLMHAYLGPDGELYEDRICRKPYLRLVYHDDKLYSAYRSTQLAVLSYFHDLTRSLDPEGNPQQTEVGNNLQLITSQREIRNSIGRLVAPRQKEEKSIAVLHDSEAPKRLLREHEVTSFKRTLPKGWKASPAARALAHELNIELAENETLVRRHKRGSTELGRITLHQAVIK